MLFIEQEEKASKYSCWIELMDDLYDEAVRIGKKPLLFVVFLGIYDDVCREIWTLSDSMDPRVHIEVEPKEDGLIYEKPYFRGVELYPGVDVSKPMKLGTFKL